MMARAGSGRTVQRVLTAAAGAGMAAAAAASIQVFYAAAYPTSVSRAGWCTAEGLFACDAAALSAVGSVAGIPIGWFGLVLGAALVLSAVLPSRMFDRTMRSALLLNAGAVIALFFYSTLALKSLCLVCTAYGAFSLLGAFALLRWRPEHAPLFAPAPAHALVLLAGTATGAWGLGVYGDSVRQRAETLEGMRAVAHFYSLPQVAWPSEISPYRLYSATPEFEDAAIRIVEYADPLCIDCRVFAEQLNQLAAEFEGRINLAYQFFPLEAACNDVVDKDKHPGACDLSYMAAWDATKFRAIHDEIVANPVAAKDRSWQRELGRRFGVEAALTDAGVQERVHRLIRTGTEYERTSDRFAHGIRSTPTLIINNRMIIGTMPTDQLRAIFRALVDEHEHGGARFIENWLSPGCVLPADGEAVKPCGT